MKKIVLIIICMLFLTGCDLNYEINFNKDGITENITANIDGNIYEIAEDIDGDGFYIQKELVENKIPAFKDYSDYYNKKINVYGNTSKVNLNYEYNYDEYENAYLLHRCFENVSVINDEDYLYVSLGGYFKCFESNDIQIKMTADYDVIKHNADEVKDGKYIWNIEMADDENKVEFQLAKNIEKQGTNFLDVLKVILIVIMILAGATIFFFRKNFNRY